MSIFMSTKITDMHVAAGHESETSVLTSLVVFICFIKLHLLLGFAWTISARWKYYITAV